MFRPMVRQHLLLTDAECVEILQNEKRGVLSVTGDDGWPYGMPLDHWYCEENGRLYFHTGREGHRTDALRRDARASYCVYDGGWAREGEWALNIRSVIVFGRVRFVEDHDRALEITRRLSLKFTDDMDYIEREIARSGANVAVLEMIPEHMTGKRVHEA